MKRDNAIHVSRSSRATQLAARKLAENLLRTSRKRKGAAVIALQGELGAGKTTFAQGFLRAFGVKGRVVSPTFIFVRRYVLPRKRQRECNRAGFWHAYHFDLYRVRRAEDLRRVGFYEALRDQKAVVLIEWPERAGRAVPRDAVHAHMKHGRDERERNIRLTP